VSRVEETLVALGEVVGDVEHLAVGDAGGDRRADRLGLLGRVDVGPGGAGDAVDERLGRAVVSRFGDRQVVGEPLREPCGERRGPLVGERAPERAEAAWVVSRAASTVS
jgi:hypothetical protein